MTKTYTKRIGFLVSAQTLVPHGGIGQFTKSFCNLMEANDIRVDIITDKAPQSVSTEFLTEISANVIYAPNPLSYADHGTIFMFEDSFCYERMSNFRNSVVKALSTNIYDAFVCNTYETVQVVSTLGLSDFIQTIAYTHLESQIFEDTSNPFLEDVNEMMRKQLLMSKVTIGTQSVFNCKQFSNAVHLPIPLAEPTLLQKYMVPREGVLFIGRYEPKKHPDLYLSLIKQTGLPAKIMTNANGAKKFEEQFKQLGITDYEIAIGVTGQKKVDFISRCRVAFNPSTVESFGLAFQEQLIQLPTYVLEHQRWTKNFNNHYFFETDKKSMAKDVLSAYHLIDTAEKWYAKGSVEKAYLDEAEVFEKWNTCFDRFQCKKSTNKTSKIYRTDGTVKYADFIASLGRKLICIDDPKSVLGNKHNFRVIHTATDTYLTKDDSFSVPDESGPSIFEW